MSIERTLLVLMWTTLRVCGWLLVGLAGIQCPRAGQAQELAEPPSSAAPEVEIIGPPKQMVMVFIRYYRDGNNPTTAKTVGIRHQIESPPARIALEFGTEAARVWVVNPSRQPVHCRLLLDNRVAAEASATGPAAMQVAVGDCPEEPTFRIPRVLLNATEVRWLQQVIECLEGKSSEGLLVAPPLGRVDWPTFDAFTQVVRQRWGQPLPEAYELDGWLSWDGALGTRVLHGSIPLSNHQALRVTLIRSGGKLLDIIPEEVDLPDDWFAGPTSIEPYRLPGELMVYSLLTGDTNKAMELFSPSYRQDIDLEELRSLAGRLRDKYGGDIRQLRFKRSVVGPYDFDIRSRPLWLDYVVEFESDRRCLARVTFMFPCHAHRIARGHLAAVDFAETWQSAAPQRFELARTAVEAIIAASQVEDQQERRSLLTNIPWSRQLALVQDRADATTTICNVLDRTGKIDAEVDWDLWYGDALGGYPFLAGELKAGEQSIVLRVEVLDDGILGVSFHGPTLADSTLLDVHHDRDCRQHFQEFWRRLLSGEVDAAHAMLARSFQDQVAPTKLRELRDAMPLPPAEHLQRIEVDPVGLSNRLDRVFPVMITVTGAAYFDGHPPLTLLAEYRIAEDQTIGLYDFTTAFQLRTPVRDHGAIEKLAKALEDSSGDQLIGMLAPADRERVMPPLTQAFLRELHGNLGPSLALSTHRRRVERIYESGQRTESMEGVIQSADGHHEALLSATLLWDHLQGFQVVSPQPLRSLRHIDPALLVEQVMKRTAKALLNGNREELQYLLVPELRDAETLQKLEKIRAEWIGVHGPWQSYQVEHFVVDDEHNTLTATVRWQFENGTVRSRLDFLADAFAVHLHTLQPLPAHD
ncbi:MAG: hypothetical protein KatS3mg111_3841 [Pirellulaceae bacterium]|nr:MAG: hypothetical protein KatS3mg111_3841 [Pirellulaceae bacterium]